MRILVIGLLAGSVNLTTDSEQVGRGGWRIHGLGIVENSQDSPMGGNDRLADALLDTDTERAGYVEQLIEIGPGEYDFSMWLRVGGRDRFVTLEAVTDRPNTCHVFTRGGAMHRYSCPVSVGEKGTYSLRVYATASFEPEAMGATVVFGTQLAATVCYGGADLTQNLNCRGGGRLHFTRTTVPLEKPAP